MITPRTLVVTQRVRLWIEDHQAAAAKYTNLPFVLGPSGVFDLHELAAEMYAQGFHDGACVGREQARSEMCATTPEEDQ